MMMIWSFNHITTLVYVFASYTFAPLVRGAHSRSHMVRSAYWCFCASSKKMIARSVSAFYAHSTHHRRPRVAFGVSRLVFALARSRQVSTTHHEADILSVLPEALTADVQVVLADDRPLVFTHAAVDTTKNPSRSVSRLLRVKALGLPITHRARIHPRPSHGVLHPPRALHRRDRFPAFVSSRPPSLATIARAVAPARSAPGPHPGAGRDPIASRHRVSSSRRARAPSARSLAVVGRVRGPNVVVSHRACRGACARREEADAGSLARGTTAPAARAVGTR